MMAQMRPAKARSPRRSQAHQGQLFFSGLGLEAGGAALALLDLMDYRSQLRPLTVSTIGSCVVGDWRGGGGAAVVSWYT